MECSVVSLVLGRWGGIWLCRKIGLDFVLLCRAFLIPWFFFPLSTSFRLINFNTLCSYIDLNSSVSASMNSSRSGPFIASSLSFGSSKFWIIWVKFLLYSWASFVVLFLCSVRASTFSLSCLTELEVYWIMIENKITFSLLKNKSRNSFLEILF